MTPACNIFPGKPIYLFDTPGFDDTNRSDFQIQGSANKNIQMLKTLHGDNALKNVILATIMWDCVTEKVET